MKKRDESEFDVVGPYFKNSHPKVFLGKGVLKICSKVNQLSKAALLKYLSGMGVLL